jgi:transposase
MVVVSMGMRDRRQIPPGTVAVVRAACPRGTHVTRLRDALGPVFDDARFAGWFADEGRPGLAPGLLALVCVLQAMEDLCDRAAADAARTRLDWKYALGLELTDTGFDFSVLSKFRDRMCTQDRAQELLTAMLGCADAAGLLRRRSKVRTDSTHVLARTRTLNRLEKLGETFRLALEQIAAMAPGWLGPRLKPHWAKEFTRPVQIARLPGSDRARQQWGRQIAADGAWLLEQIDTDPAEGWLARLPTVQALRAVWGQECVADDAGTWHPRTTRIDPGAEHIDSPHDVDVRWSSKRSTQWSGYEVHLSETCEEDLPHLIVAVHTTQATESDIPALADVHTRLAANHATPGEHHLDEGYVTAEAIATAQTDEIEIVGPLTRDSSWQAKQNNGYDESAFTLDWDAQVATCPQGRTSCSWTRRAHMAGDGAAIRFRHQVLPSLPRTPLMHPLGVRRTPDRPRLPGTARDPGPKPRSAGRPGLEPPLRPTFRHRRRHLRSRTRLRPAPHPVPRHGQNRRRTRPDRLRHQRRTHRRLDRTRRPTRPTTQPVPADQALLNHPGHSELEAAQIGGFDQGAAVRVEASQGGGGRLWSWASTDDNAARRRTVVASRTSLFARPLGQQNPRRGPRGPPTPHAHVSI